ncbi:hypothetical protein [Hydrogenophaga soli]
MTLSLCNPLADTLHPDAGGPSPLGGTGEDLEHLLLIRRLAALQQRVSQLVLSYEAQLAHWKHQLMRQSVRLMLERTRADWGLVVTPRPEHAPRQGAQQVLVQAQARAVVCRTGCQMDGDHWRQGDQCRLSGQDCADSA